MFATAVGISVMLMDQCLPSCYVFLYSVIMFFMLVVLSYGPCLVVVHVGDGLRCMTIVCSEYRRYACFFTSSCLNTCMVVSSLLHGIIVDASVMSCYE